MYFTILVRRSRKNERTTVKSPDLGTRMNNFFIDSPLNGHLVYRMKS